MLKACTFELSNIFATLRKNTHHMKKIAILFSLLIIIGAGCGTKPQDTYVHPSAKIITPPEKLLSMDQNIERQSVVIKTNQGDITIELFNELSPKTVENFVKLAQDGFYDGTRFHRVIKDFMIQGGDPLSKDPAQKNAWGTGGPGYAFADEFNNEKLVKGSVAMANSGPNTNGSQFFIVTTEATPWLDGRHTNFGRVIEGLDVVMEIEQTATGPRDVPTQDIIIESVEIK